MQSRIIHIPTALTTLQMDFRVMRLIDCHADNMNRFGQVPMTTLSVN